MRWLDQSPGRAVNINGKEHLFFSGYAYLGMSSVPEFIKLIHEGMEQYGVLFPSSRISNTRLKLYDETEAMLTELTKQQETVLYSSGYLAGRAVSELVNQQQNIFVAPGAHPAINTTATVLSTDWQAQLLQLTHQHRQLFLLTDSVHPLRSSVTEFSFLEHASANCHLTCIIDDSHGIGLLGDDGEGIAAHLPQLPNVEYVLTYSLSKAFHVNGGAVSCSKKIAQALHASSYYTASTAMAPFLCHALVQAQHIYRDQRKRLQQNIDQFKSTCAAKFSSHPSLPIFLLNDECTQDFFDPYNIIISSFSYPNPDGEIINRIVLNALHTKHDIAALCNALETAG